MKFVPRDLGEAAEVNSGGGARGIWVELGKLGLLTVAAILFIWIGFQLLAVLAVKMITPEQEARMLGVLLPELAQWDPATEEDQARLDMIRGAFDKLTALPDVPPIEYRLLFVHDETPNAFAFPGGAIGITRGLVEALGDEEIAYAFVLGHELGHFKNRDHIRGIIRQLGAGAAFAIIFGSSGASGLTSNAHRFMELGYSRSQELAADDFGVHLLQQAYPDTHGAERFFERILEMEDSPSWAYMFQTHPDTRKRIERLRDQLDD